MRRRHSGFGIRRPGKNSGAWIVLIWATLTLLGWGWEWSSAQDQFFEIKSFAVEGNTLFPERAIQDLLGGFLGAQKTAADVEKARGALEKLYHDKGYPAVLVNIPEQSVQDGNIRLQVIESKIGKSRVTGNRYFTEERILRDLPSLNPGKILYVPDIQADIARLNRNPDLKASPVLSPGKELGVTDVEIKVADSLPLHGSVELSNRSTHDTTDLRLNALLRYDNLWQRDHSFSLQYQMSPQDLDEVKALAFSYVLPAPWNGDHQMALYGVFSDSATAFGEGFQTIGSGKIFGARYVLPLAPYRLYSHTITLGLDYKDINENLSFRTGSTGETETPVKYAPFSIAYSSSIPDESGMLRFSAGLNMAFRGLVTNEREIEIKRFKARGNYIYMTAGAERIQKLPKGFGLFLKLDGQISDQPLISNEQLIAGGMQSVRGYKESEAAGDDGLHGILELNAPDFSPYFKVGKWIQLTPFIFYDFAWLHVQEALPGQDSEINLHGLGIGMRGGFLQKWEYEVDWGIALAATDKTPRYTNRLYFRLKYQF